jgi:AcrR family transcriptional regulator
MTSTAPPPRSGFHHGDLANALLVEAHRLLMERGVQDFSLREAARAVGVSPNAAYRHFDDKGSLLAALARRGFALMASDMEEAPGEAPDPIQRLRATGQGYLRFAQKEPALFELMFGPFGAGSDRDVTSVGPRSGLSPAELLSYALDQLVTTGRVPQSRRDGAEMLFWPAIHGLAVLAIAGVWTSNAEDAFEHMFRLLCSALDLAQG